MTTATLEAPAETTEETEARDTFTRDLIREAVKDSRRGARATTATNLRHAERLVQAIEHEILKAANTLDDVKTFRAQTIGLFSSPLSRAEGRTITARHLTEYVAVHYLRSCVPFDSQATFDRVPWEALRTLAKWSIPLPGNTALTKGESYEEAWQVKTGCDAKLLDLINNLAKHPMSPSGLRSEMDAHERSLSGVAKKTDALQGIEDITRFLGNIVKTADKLKLSKRQLAWWILKSRTLTVADIIDAAGQIQAEDVATAQPATAATATLNDSGKPNHDPLANAQTRKVA